jgi:hypothetical protein
LNASIRIGGGAAAMELRRSPGVAMAGRWSSGPATAPKSGTIIPRSSSGAGRRMWRAWALGGLWRRRRGVGGAAETMGSGGSGGGGRHQHLVASSALHRAHEVVGWTGSGTWWDRRRMAEPLDSSGCRGFRGRRHSPGLLQEPCCRPFTPSDDRKRSLDAGVVLVDYVVPVAGI